MSFKIKDDGNIYFFFAFYDSGPEHFKIRGKLFKMVKTEVEEVVNFIS